MANKNTNHPPDTKPRFFYGYIVVIAVYILQMVMYGSRTSFGVFFKPMLAEFGWSRALISSAFSVSQIVQGLSSIVMGGLNDRFGPRVVLTLCGFLLGLGYLLTSQINAAWQLYLFYALITGIGMGGLIAPQLSTIVRWFVKRRNVMTGFVIAGGGTGRLIMPPLVNWFISTYGWRQAYIIMGTLVMVVIVLIAQFLKRDPTQIGQLPYGDTKVPEQELNKEAEGLSLREATHTIQFWLVVVMLFSFGFDVTTIQIHIVPHAIDLGISAATAASILSASGAALIAGGILLGIVADRIGNKQVYIICFTILAAALFWLSTAREAWILYLCTAAVGFSHGGMSMLQSPTLAELFGLRSHGLILGSSHFCLVTGAAIGPFLAGYIFDIRGSYEIAFLICATLAVIGLVLSVLLRPIKIRGAYNPNFNKD